MSRAVLEVMAICGACWEARTVTRLQHLLASVSNQNDLAFDDPNELVFVSVPVALTGPGVRREVQEFTPN